MPFDPGSKTSLREIYSAVESRMTGNSSLGLYFNQLRVGISVIFAGTALAAISFLLFAPSFPFLPFGKLGQVTIGIATTFVAFRLYKLFRISNETFLNAGRNAEGQDKIWSRLTQSGYRRFFSSVGFLGLAACIVVLGFGIFATFSASTGYNADGFLAEISPELELLLFVSVLVFEMGVVINFVGCILVSWSLFTPFLTSIHARYRLLKYNSIARASKLLYRITGKAYYPEPVLFCPQCYNATFKYVTDDTNSPIECKIVCANCGDGTGISESLNNIQGESSPDLTPPQ